MIGQLDEAIATLLKQALPGLLGGATPVVSLNLATTEFEIDPESADAIAGEPRADDRTDLLPFNADPNTLYQLSQSPYPGARRVWLRRGDSDRITLRPEEVQWDAIDSRKFLLTLRPTRDLTGITSVQILYGVTAVFTKIKLKQQLLITLQSSQSDRLEQAEALAVGVITLNRQNLLDNAQAQYSDGDYGTAIEVKSFQMVRGDRLVADARQLLLTAQVELKATRTLGADEGQPIERILSPGVTLTGDRAIGVRIDVMA
ncbi:MAG: hypothetical protein VKJ24_15455 [Synechococcales bacterium]|nr:hypothetical protein [Synechococcales bacterium]